MSEQEIERQIVEIEQHRAAGGAFYNPLLLGRLIWGAMDLGRDDMADRVLAALGA